VAAGDDEADGRKLRLAGGEMCFKQNGVDVAFEMIDGDKRLADGHGQDFAVGDADKQRADESRTARHGDGVEVVQREAGLLEGFADDGNDLAEMFAGGKLRNYSTVLCVQVDLRGDNVGKDLPAVGDNRGGGFVAGRFDAEDTGHWVIESSDH